VRTAPLEGEKRKNAKSELNDLCAAARNGQPPQLHGGPMRLSQSTFKNAATLRNRQIEQ
jgi:hypothetical protein